MKKSSHLLLVLLFFLATATGSAQANTVIDVPSCKQWLDGQDVLTQRGVYTVWLNGYVSGANASYGDMVGRDFIKNSADKISVVDWTDAYCRKYPDKMLDDSANALIKLLKRDTPF